ncbi:hypothetical protein ILUMI_06245 [Ignelater luminosus]|uniref:Uncharacterized protein n=1 Tax=Ignelater luminosus TaxID=2038154 RepID=A0A8K0GJA3_IGNLU|nr:hypothetical protein ILUMI_06245 [Ignelater luminosus]
METLEVEHVVGDSGREFQRERISLGKQYGGDPSKTAGIPENIDVVRKLMMKDRHVSSETFPIQAELVSFNASDSGIQNITEKAFAVLPMLQYLYLQGNKISGISPEAFVNLRQLYELDLDNNQLTELTPRSFHGVESVSVSISHNRIKQIYKNTFEGVLGIMALNLSYNQIAILHTESLKGLENLEILDLQHNKLCYIPLGIFQYVQTIKDLNLSGNKIRAFSPGTFSGLKNLLSLNLAENEFSEFDASALLPLAKISNLDISNNGLYYLDAHSVHTNAPTIRTLTINDNLWSCSLLTNLVQFFKSVNIDTLENTCGRYDVTNINGVACSIEPINVKISFEKFLHDVTEQTKRNVNFC